MKTRRDFLKLAGASLVGVAGVASASENPFGLAKMDSGYTQVAMEGKCGGMSKKDAGHKEHGEESHSKNKMPEGKCGEGKCGGKMKGKASDGKMPEGKCGSMKD